MTGPLPRLSPEAVASLALPAGIERVMIKNRDQWLAARSSDVTASQVACLFPDADYPYGGPFSLAEQKRGLAPPIEESRHMKRGHAMEPIASAELAQRFPDWDIYRLRDAYYFRDKAARMGATPDAFAVAPGRPGFGVIQFKSATRWVVKSKWRDSDGEPCCPLWVALQATQEAMLTGASWACAAVLPFDTDDEIEAHDIPLIPALWQRMKGEVADFWRILDAGSMPDPDPVKDGNSVLRYYAEKTGETIDLSGDNRITEVVDLRALLKEKEAEGAAAERERKVLDAEIIGKLGHASHGRLADGRVITVKTITVNRKPTPVSTYSYPRISIDGFGGAKPAGTSPIVPERF